MTTKQAENTREHDHLLCPYCENICAPPLTDEYTEIVCSTCNKKYGYWTDVIYHGQPIP